MRLADLCKDMRFQNVLNATFQNFYPQLRTQHQTFIAHTIRFILQYRVLL